MLNTNNINIVEDITYLEIIEDNTTIEVIDDSIEIIEIGTQGPQGIQGQGLPEGGLKGDILVKDSNANQDTIWVKNPFDTVTEYVKERYVSKSGDIITGDLEILGNLKTNFEPPEYNYIIKEHDTNPTPLDDITRNYFPYMLWFNTQTLKIYICLKNDIHNAIWQDFTFKDTLPNGESGLFTGADKAKLDNLNETFNYFKSLPESRWVINHNLHKFPTVIVTDSAFSVVECSIKYLTVDSVELKFNMPFSGKATLQ